MHKGDTSTTLSERFGEPIMALSKEERERERERERVSQIVKVPPR
jgi:hypothetical protein